MTNQAKGETAQGSDRAMMEEDIHPASHDVRDVIFTCPLKREVRISADRQTITHSAMDWSGSSRRSRGGLLRRRSQTALSAPSAMSSTTSSQASTTSI